MKYAQELAKGAPTKKAAALRAGYSEETAGNVTAQVEKSVGFKSLREFLAQDTIRQRVGKVIEEGLAATRPVVIGGEITDYPDYQARSKYVDTFLDVSGERAKTESDLTLKSEGLNIVFSNKDEDEKKEDPVV